MAHFCRIRIFFYLIHLKIFYSSWSRCWCVFEKWLWILIVRLSISKYIYWGNREQFFYWFIYLKIYSQDQQILKWLNKIKNYKNFFKSPTIFGFWQQKWTNNKNLLQFRTCFFFEKILTVLRTCWTSILDWFNVIWDNKFIGRPEIENYCSRLLKRETTLVALEEFQLLKTKWVQEINRLIIASQRVHGETLLCCWWCRCSMLIW